MPQEKGTGEPGWTEQEKGQGAPGSGDAGAAGDAVPKAGYGADDRAATESAAARVEEDNGNPEGGRDKAGPAAGQGGQDPGAR